MDIRIPGYVHNQTVKNSAADVKEKMEEDDMEITRKANPRDGTKGSSEAPRKPDEENRRRAQEEDEAAVIFLAKVIAAVRAIDGDFSLASVTYDNVYNTLEIHMSKEWD